MEYNNLIRDIKAGRLKNIYLFFGQEQYICEEIIRLIEKQVINPSFRDFNYAYLEGTNITTQNIENACETLPFMDDRRLVIVKNSPYLKGVKGIKGDAEKVEEVEQLKYLVKYIERIPQSTCLVFWQTSGNVDKRMKLFQVIKKSGEIVNFEKLKIMDMEKWLEKYLAEKGKVLQKNVLRYFMDNSDYFLKNSTKNLSDIKNEINKIIDYIGNRKELLQEDIERILPKRLENDIFKMIDAIGKKDRNTALRLLDDMLRDGENEIKILTMIARHFRILIQCSELRDRGYTSKGIATKMGVAPFVADKGISQSKYFNHAILKQAIYSTLNMDIKIKTGRINNRLALEMFIYEYTN